MVRYKVRVTSNEPRAVDSELKLDSSDEVSKTAVNQFYEQAIPADSVARAIAFAIEQPTDIGINEIVLRPLTQEF
jgi:NADP-dependent 3-hydroxy acid dehydrogenase YdfG